MTQVKIFAIVILAGIFLASCDSGKVKQLEEENAQLTVQKQTQDSLINDFMGTFNEFEENLQLIKEKENLISTNSGDPELRKSQKNQIIDDIQMINALLDQNRLMIEELTAKAEKAEGSSGALRGTIARLRRQIEAKDAEINGMKERLVALNFDMDSLNVKIADLTTTNQQLAEVTNSQAELITMQDSSIEDKRQTIEDQTIELNKAFFATGSSKELKERNILTKEGGFIGMGKTARMSTSFDPNSFTTIDIRETQRIPVNSKKVELVTPHPSEAYTLLDEDQDKVIDAIQIVDPASFWKTSRYLVVVAN